MKRRLGIAGRRVVLYAPTYRDSLDYGAARRIARLRDLRAYRAPDVVRDGYRLAYGLDLAAVRDALPPDTALVFRKHPRVIDELPSADAACVVDASDHLDELALLEAADVLITDYSSAIFDYVLTGRPILLFAPDLAAYDDEVRGLALDLEAEAPGPLLRTTAEVSEALADLDAVRAAHAERYEAFRRKWCALADAEAASRVVTAVFEAP